MAFVCIIPNSASGLDRPSMTARLPKSSMGTLINSTYVALDGVVENPHLWPSTGEGDATGEQVQTDLLRAADDDPPTRSPQPVPRDPRQDYPRRQEP